MVLVEVLAPAAVPELCPVAVMKVLVQAVAMEVLCLSVEGVVNCQQR